MKKTLPTILSLLLPLGAAQGQNFTVTGLNPSRNAVAAPRNGGLSVTVSQPLAAGSTGALRVFSSQRGGRLTGAAVVNGSTLSFYPSRTFWPGETVQATLTTAAQSTTGTALTAPQVWQVTAAALGGTGQFAGGSDVAVGAAPNSMATADVDNDGDLDLLTANTDANTVSVRLNDGRGRFSGTTEVAVDRGPTNMALADVDNDGDLDLLTANYGGGLAGSANTVSLRLNTGAGVFGGGSDIAISGTPNNLKLGDVDGDGDLDLLVTRGFGAAALLLNDGAGVFGYGPSVGIVASAELELADIDNDGDLDVLTIDTWGGSQRVLLDLNNGSGTSYFNAYVLMNAAPGNLVLGDLDGDGSPDLVTANNRAVPNYVGIQLNNGGAIFNRGVDVGLGTGVTKVALADVNGDARLDILATDYVANSTHVYLNTGGGLFATALVVPVGSGPRDLTTADLDNDGDLDLLVGNAVGNTVSVRLNNGSGPALASRRPQTAGLLTCYPNPARDQVQVGIPAGVSELTLRNTLGQQLRAWPVRPGAEATLSVQDLPAGVYQLQAGAAVARLVVE